MKKRYIGFLVGLFVCGFTAAQAQTTNLSDSNKVIKKIPFLNNTVDNGLRMEKVWRSTGAIFTLSGDELTRMISGNLLNTLQGRIPGLTVSTGSGEPGYDNPTLYVRGQSSWNIAGNRVLIYLDGYPVDMGAISSLSAYEIESVTLLKDAAAQSIYGLQGGAGVLSIRTKEGSASGKTQISVNGRFGLLSPIDLPNVLSAYDYTTYYNKALQNDGLPVKYTSPELYKAKNDPIHPNVDWYNEVLTNQSTLQDYNVSFRGGGTKAKYFVFGNYTDFAGIYKNADAIDKDYGTNAKYTKINLRANVELQLSNNLSVKANITGITEDRNTPNGFTAASLFSNLLRIPASAFPVKNPDGTWGNNAVYSFNPVQLLQQNGVYSSHARNLQTNIALNEKLDIILKGLSFNAGLSFSNQYIGTYQKGFTVPSYEIIKDANDNAVLDASGNVTYKTIGSVSQSINDGGNEHWNRTIAQAGFDYLNSFGKHTFTGMLQARQESYVHDNQVYPVRTQALIGSVTYDFDKKYIIDIAASYNGSADFKKGERFGLFPSIGLGWIATNEKFLKGNKVIDFLKVRASYGITGNINEDFRFLFEQWGATSAGWILGTGNTVRSGRLEGSYANTAFTWEQKSSMNIGVDVVLWKKLSATVDVFNEDRIHILETPTGIPDFTGINLKNTNTGKVNNKGFEASLKFNDKKNKFDYYAGASVAFARNKVTARSEDVLPYQYLYSKGYRLGQMRGLVYNGFYQLADFDANGTLLAGIPKSSFTNVKPGDLKFVDQDGNGIINDYDKIPMNFAKLPEITLGFNIGFKYAGFDFDAYLQGVLNRTVSLLDDAYNYTHPIANNNNITIFSINSWTPETAASATTPRLSTQNNENNNKASDFWMRNGSFFKLRSIEAGYTFPQKGVLKKIDAVRVFVNGTNLFTWDKIEDLEAERLSMGYPLMKAVSFGFKMKF